MVPGLVVVVDMAFVALVVADMASEVFEVYMELEYCLEYNLELVLVAWHCMVVVLVMGCIQHGLVGIHRHRIEMLSF